MIKPNLRLLFCVVALLDASAVFSSPITIWISSLRDKHYYDEMITLYRESVDKGFEAKVQAFGFREMPDKLAIALKTGTDLPDVVQLDEVFFGTYLSGDTPFLPIDDRIKEAGLDRMLLENRLSLFEYKGQCFGLAQSVSASMLYYRRDLFEKFGVDVSEMETWEGLRAAGERLAARGQPLLAIDPSYFEILLRQRGSDLFSPSGEVLPDMELAVETLNWLGALVKDGIGLEPDRGTIFDPVFFTGDIANDEVLAVVGAEWYGTDLLQQFAPEQSGKWGVLPLPAWSVGEGAGLGLRTSTFSGQGLLILSNSKQIDASWDFVRFVMSDYHANIQRFTGKNSFPAYLPVFSAPELLKPTGYFGDDSLGKLVVELAPSVPRVITSPKRPMAVFMIREGLLTSVVSGYMGAEEALAKMKERIEDSSAISR